jgi:hypothetical protein
VGTVLHTNFSHSAPPNHVNGVGGVLASPVMTSSSGKGGETMVVGSVAVGNGRSSSHPFALFYLFFPFSHIYIYIYCVVANAFLMLMCGKYFACLYSLCPQIFVIL